MKTKFKMKMAGKHLILTLILAMILTAIPSTAFAGNLNPDEEQLLPYIYGTFEKDGKVYKARKSYQDAAVDYLKQDDVDLTAAECQHYISKVFANIQRGIDEGYLYEISGEENSSQKTENSSTGSTGAVVSSGNTSSKNEKQEEKPKTNPDGTPEGSIQVKEEETGSKILLIPVQIKVGESLSSGQNQVFTLREDGSFVGAEGWPAAVTVKNGSVMVDSEGNLKNASGEQIYQDESGAFVNEKGEKLSITVDSPKPRFLEKLEEEPSFADAEVDFQTDTDRWMAGKQDSSKLLLTGNVICTVLLIGTLILSLTFKLLDKKAKKKRKLRTGVRVIGDICFLLSLAGLLYSTHTILISGQQYQVINRMERSGFYEFVQEEMNLKTQEFSGYLDLSDESCRVDNATIVVAGRQQLQAELEGRSFMLDTSLITIPLEKAVDSYLKEHQLTLTEKAEQGLEKRLSMIEGYYQKLLHWPYSQYAKQEIEKRNLLAMSAAAYLITVVASGVMIVFLHYYKHRGYRELSILAAITSVSWLIWLNVSSSNGKLIAASLTPEYMRKFFELTAADQRTQGNLIGISGLVIAFVLYLAVKIRKEGK